MNDSFSSFTDDFDDPNEPTKAKKRRSSVLDIIKESMKTSSAMGDVFSTQSRVQAASAVDHGEKFFGLPSKVQQMMKKYRGIKELYDWQKQCLHNVTITEDRNFILSLPTSGGKTLVAEILMLQQIMCLDKDVLLVLPYVSIVQEKIRAFVPFGLEFDFLVEEYAASKGRIPPIRRKKKRCLFIATIEKALSLVNSLIETGRMQDVGLVVVDELHMLGEGESRGAVLEHLLCKIKFCASKCQIIGMSATLSNIEDIQRFLNAELISYEFRPVKLTEFVKIEQSLYEVDFKSREESFLKFRRKIEPKPQKNSQDPHQVANLVAEMLQVNASCIVFCPTKLNCENVVTLLCKTLPRNLMDVKFDERKKLYDTLCEEGGGHVCPILTRSLRCGIAYHHSGLTADERKLIQDGYLEGILSVLCCTSTLAAGVNLPAKRVILRSVQLGRDFMSLQQYKQMVGRAGRAGFDETGESIAIVESRFQDRFLNMLRGPFEECRSKMLHNDHSLLKSMILSVIGLEVCKTRKDIRSFLDCTLLAIQQDKFNINIDRLSSESLTFLLNSRLIVESDDVISITKLGTAAFKGSIDINLVHKLFNDLKSCVTNLILCHRLHLIFCVTPYDFGVIQPDWTLYYEEYCSLKEELKVADVLGITELYLMNRSRNLSTKKASGLSDETATRFYLALIVHRVWNGLSIFETAARFNISRGSLQQLMSSTASFASSVCRFCDPLEKDLWALKSLLPDFSKQLTYCCHMELMPLMEIQGMKQARARQLYNAGFKTCAHISQLDPTDLVKGIEFLNRNQARVIIEGAKMLLWEKVEILREEADNLLLPTQSDTTDSVNDSVVMYSILPN